MKFPDKNKKYSSSLLQNQYLYVYLFENEQYGPDKKHE